MKILGKLSEETRGPLMKLHNTLNGKVGSVFRGKCGAGCLRAAKDLMCLMELLQSVEDFLTNLEAAAEVCGFMLKKGDKKKER